MNLKKFSEKILNLERFLKMKKVYSDLKKISNSSKSFKMKKNLINLWIIFSKLSQKNLPHNLFTLPLLLGLDIQPTRTSFKLFHQSLRKPNNSLKWNVRDFLKIKELSFLISKLFQLPN